MPATVEALRHHRSRPGSLLHRDEFPSERNRIDVFDDLVERTRGFVAGVVTAVSESDATTDQFAHNIPLSISADGHWLAFQSEVSDLMPVLVDANNTFNAFVFDVPNRRRALVSTAQFSLSIAVGVCRTG